MTVFNSLKDLPEFRNAVITIGSFDGVHQGHQKILERVNQLAKSCDGESVVVTFHPHPRLLLYPDDPSLRLLNTIEEKVALLEKYGIKYVVVVPFTKAFSEQSPDSYIQDFLLGKFSPKYIVIGYDHHFGKNRSGNIGFLKKYEEPGNFNLVEIEKQEVDDIAVSSTKIRKALESGDIQTANQLLGHPYSFSGTVIRGHGVGKKLGFPTANMHIESKTKLIPSSGIYAVRALHNARWFNALLYIGNRPTLTQENQQSIEVHILDFKKDLYDEQLTVELIDFIRDDREFENTDQLKTQMKADEAKARKIFQQTFGQTLKNENPKLPSVAVVILNYNGRKLMERFLPSVSRSAYPNAELIIADNCSTDDSIAFLNQKFPNFSILQLPGNYGFAKGYNEALKQIKADYFVLLNSDVEVAENWIEPIVKMMEADKTIGICQPKILASENRQYFEYAGACGGMIDKWGYPFCRGRILDTVEKDSGQYDNQEEIFWASGAAMFVRAGLFQQLGGFDEDYYAHQEEIDFCWRAKRAGYKVMVEPRSVVYHLGGGTLEYQNPRKTYLNFRNSLFSILKNENAPGIFAIIAFRLVLDGVAGIHFLIKGQFLHFKSILRAHISFYKSLSDYIKKRKFYNKLIEENRISDTPNMTGRFKGSIVWNYFILGKKHFKNLKKNQ